MPNSSIEMTAGQISEVSTGKMEAYIRAIVYTIVGVLNIALSYYWIPVYGIIGGVYSTALCMLIGNGFVMNYYYYICMNINIKYSKVLARNYKDCDYSLCVGSDYAVYKELFIYTTIFECMDSFVFYLCSSTVGVLY